MHVAEERHSSRLRDGSGLSWAREVVGRWCSEDRAVLGAELFVDYEPQPSEAREGASACSSAASQNDDGRPVSLGCLPAAVFAIFPIRLSCRASAVFSF